MDMQTQPQSAQGLVNPLSFCTDGVDLPESRRNQRSHTDPLCSHASTEWRDWANLFTDLAENIASRLLTFDVVEYIRFRATCKPWRGCTDDPHTCHGMDSRFRPRDWIALSQCASLSRRTLLNVNTGARIDIDFPTLATHHHLGAANGLLVLGHKRTNNICLLHPFTGVLTEFPAHFAPSKSGKRIRVNLSAINGVGIDDSTFPSTLVIILRKGSHQVIYAKPGDEHWSYVHVNNQRPQNFVDKVIVHSPVSLGGRCYFTTWAGIIMALDFSSGAEPRMVYLLDQDPQLVNSQETTIFSYLVRSQGRMLMVRYLYGANLVQEGGYNETDIFMWRECPSHMEVLEVDLERRRLITQRGVGFHHAAFIGAAHTVMVSTEKFPRIASNAVYLNYFMQALGHFAAYHFEDQKTMSARDFQQRRNGKNYPCACHWELEDYLMCDVEKGYRSVRSSIH